MTLHVGMLVFPNVTQLDLTGPFEVMHRLPDAEVHLVARDTAPVRAQGGLTFVPSTSLDACPKLDVVFVPGGFGVRELMTDPSVIAFLRAHAATARYVTSVCTGSLVLGVAGLLDGYAATTHWAYVELLPMFGARPVGERVVIDRNRITAGGVTSGIDFGLAIAAEIAGEPFAKGIQLGLEYDPSPPFRCGHPKVADPEILAAVRARFAQPVEAQRATIAAAMRR